MLQKKGNRTGKTLIDCHEKWRSFEQDCDHLHEDPDVASQRESSEWVLVSSPRAGMMSYTQCWPSKTDEEGCKGEGIEGEKPGFIAMNRDDISTWWGPSRKNKKPMQKSRKSKGRDLVWLPSTKTVFCTRSGPSRRETSGCKGNATEGKTLDFLPTNRNDHRTWLEPSTRQRWRCKGHGIQGDGPHLTAYRIGTIYAHNPDGLQDGKDVANARKSKQMDLVSWPRVRTIVAHDRYRLKDEREGPPLDMVGSIYKKEKRWKRKEMERKRLAFVATDRDDALHTMKIVWNGEKRLAGWRVRRRWTSFDRGWECVLSTRKWMHAIEENPFPTADEEWARIDRRLLDCSPLMYSDAWHQLTNVGIAVDSLVFRAQCCCFNDSSVSAMFEWMTDVLFGSLMVPRASITSLQFVSNSSCRWIGERTKSITCDDQMSCICRTLFPPNESSHSNRFTRMICERQSSSFQSDMPWKSPLSSAFDRFEQMWEYFSNQWHIISIDWFLRHYSLVATSKRSRYQWPTSPFVRWNNSEGCPQDRCFSSRLCWRRRRRRSKIIYRIFPLFRNGLRIFSLVSFVDDHRNGAHGRGLHSTNGKRRSSFAFRFLFTVRWPFCRSLFVPSATTS